MKTKNEFYIEVSCQQLNHEGERICGDVFLSKRSAEEDRTIAVLSDGMGHGVKANILATLTATMAMNFTEEHKDHLRIAEIIMNTLPICAERHISYATFTVVDIVGNDLVNILEFDNPQTIIVRGGQLYDPKWQSVTLESGNHAGKEIHNCSFVPQKEDRILFFSDGVTQSGLGFDNFLFGWGHDNLESYILKLMSADRRISADRLASKVVNMSHINDNYQSKDDTSCGAIYFRDPRKLLICTGPPFEKERDKEYATVVDTFDGKKILCGATTSDIISRELNREIEDSFEFTDPDLPPISFMEGIDLLTEGILTLSKVDRLLKIHNYAPAKGPADMILRHIFASDQIDFLIGTGINIAHQDPNLPVELEIRRTVVRRIADQLENKFLKKVKLRFI